MNNLFFSIITVSYNSENTIQRTIESVLHQTFVDYEYIIIDGLSTDGTINIVKQYEPLFCGKMRWISEKDSGIYNAMNKGISMAKGRIIGIVNSDDWLDLNALNNVYMSAKAMNDNYDSIYCGNLLFHYQNGSKLLRIASDERLKKYARFYDIGVFHPATFVSLDVYKKIGLFDETFELNADTDFIVRCYEAKVNFIFINSMLTNMSDGGATNSGMIMKELEDRKRVLKKHCKSSVEFCYLWSLSFLKIYLKKIMPHALLIKIRLCLE